VTQQQPDMVVMVPRLSQDQPVQAPKFLQMEFLLNVWGILQLPIDMVAVIVQRNMRLQLTPDPELCLWEELVLPE
jgi:hypothetical protein